MAGMKTSIIIAMVLFSVQQCEASNNTTTTTTTPNTTITSTTTITTTPNTTTTVTSTVTTTPNTTTALTTTTVTTTVTTTPNTTTATTTATTTTTVTTVGQQTTVASDPVTTVSGSVALTVDNASSLVNNSAFADAVAAGIAVVANVPASTVTVQLAVGTARRLSSASLRKLSGTITASYTIVVPLSQARTAAAAITAAETATITTAISTQLSQSSDSSLNSVSVTVASKTVPSFIDPLQAGTAGASKMVSFSAVRAAFTMFALAVAMLLLLRDDE